MPRFDDIAGFHRGKMPLLHHIATGSTSRILLTVLLIGLSACSKEEDMELVPDAKTSPEAQQAAKVPARTPQNSFKVPARSVEKRCDNFKNGQRVRYKLTASEKIHVGVSSGKILGTDNLVAVHLARTEARSFTVTKTGEHCVHLDNRNSRPVQVSLTLSTRGNF